MSEVINRDSKYATTSSEQGGLLDVLLALKSNIMRGLNVATFAEVQEVDEANQIVTVRPFPLVDGESEKNIACFSCLMPHLDGENIAWSSMTKSFGKKDVVLVVFLNRNSSQSFKQAKLKQTLSTLKENSELHSDKFGVIIGMCYKYQ